jgi:hypothetical protein
LCVCQVKKSLLTPKKFGMSRGNLSTRLENLEASARSNLMDRCPECALSPGEPRRIVIVEGDTEHDPHERCSVCGRFLWTTITLVYEDALASPDAEGGGQ